MKPLLEIGKARGVGKSEELIAYLDEPKDNTSGIIEANEMWECNANANICNALTEILKNIK